MMQLWFSSSLISAVSAVIEGHDDAEHRGVGGAEEHRRLAAVEGGEAGFQVHVGLVGAADEAHRAGADAERAARRLLRVGQLRPQGHAQIVVRVHLEEGLVALPRQQVARPPLAFGRQHAGDHRLGSLEGPPLAQGRQLGGEGLIETRGSGNQWASLWTSSEDSFFSRFSSMSRTMAGRSYCGFHPHSCRAALSSSDMGQESAIACRTGSTR